jgi:hypothetical protein
MLKFLWMSWRRACRYPIDKPESYMTSLVTWANISFSSNLTMISIASFVSTWSYRAFDEVPSSISIIAFVMRERLIIASLEIANTWLTTMNKEAVVGL